MCLYFKSLVRIAHYIAPVLIILVSIISYGKQTDSTYLAVGYSQFKAADYDSAIINLDKARSLLSNTNKYQDYTYALLYLGKSHGRKSNYDIAQQYFDIGLKVALEYLGEENDATLRLYDAIDYNYGGQSMYKEAFEYAYKSLVIRQNMFGDQHKSLITNYNSIAFNVRMQGKYDSAMIWYNKALSLAKKVYKAYESEGNTARTIAGMAWLYGAKGQYPKAKEYYERAYDISVLAYGKEHPSTLQKLKMLGWCAMQMGDYISALEYTKETARLRKEILGEDHPHMATAFHNLGRTYMLLGEYDKAIAYQQRGNTIWSAKHGAMDGQMANFNNNLGNSYTHKGDYEKALSHYKKAEEVALKSLRSGHLELANTYQLIADLYKKTNDQDRQYEYLQKALEISENFTGKGHINSAMIHRKLGQYFGTRSDHIKELSYYDQALKVFKKSYGAKHPMIVQTYEDIGDHYLHINNIDSALAYYQKGIIELSQNFNSTQIAANPPIEDIIWKIDALSVLAKKAEAMYLKDQTSIDAPLETFALASSLIDHLKKSFIRENDKIDLYSQVDKIFSRVIDLCYTAYEQTNNKSYLEYAFEYSEKSKAMVLYEVYNTTRAKVFANIPDSAVAKETQLKMEIALYETQLFKAQQKNDSVRMKTVRNYLFQAKNEHDQFIQHLEQTYPEYYSLKYDGPKVSLSHYQKELINQQSALIEYYITEHHIYAFIVTKNNTAFYRINKPEDFAELTNSYRKTLSDYEYLINDPQASDELYVSSASRLYDLLMKELLTTIEDDVSHLIIIPDGILWHTNFQTLLTQRPEAKSVDYKQLPYLIKDYSISLAHSANILSVIKKEGRKPRVSFAGFAPSYTSLSQKEVDTLNHNMVALLVRDGELPLPGAFNEVNNIATLMKGTSYTGELATESNFKDRAAAYDILHLAMHSLLNDENPAYTELVFNPSDSVNDGLLNISEIYNLNLKADLVVLSACNTGYGKIQKGEGPISLSRAFNYAGCPSIVMSLWKIPDIVTEELMVSFYNNLNKGYSKNEGLQKAQLQHLQSTSDPLYHHPYFWSGFMTIGNTQPIKSGSINNSVLVFSIAAIFLLFLYSIELRRSRAS